MSETEETDPRAFKLLAYRGGKEQLPVKLRAMVTSSKHDDRPHRYITLGITDERSGLRFLELELPFSAWGELVSAGGEVPAVADLRVSDRIGKYQQVKVEILWFPKDTPWFEYSHTKPRDQRPLQPFRDAVAALEVDGWKGGMYLGGRILHRQGEEGYEVTFHRYLDEKPDKLRVNSGEEGKEQNA